MVEKGPNKSILFPLIYIEHQLPFSSDFPLQLRGLPGGQLKGVVAI
jgi:hypothetical protein